MSFRVLKYHLLPLFFVALLSCTRKMDDIPVANIVISDDVLAVDVNELQIVGSVESNVTISEMWIEWASSPDFSDSHSFRLSVENSYFTISITDLNPSSTYYYRYLLKNKLQSLPINSLNGNTFNLSQAKRGVKSLTLDKLELILLKGENSTLVATIYPTDIPGLAVVWKSEDERIAAVDQNGSIRAVAGGTTYVTASCGYKSARCRVEVRVTIESISFNPDNFCISTGSTIKLTPTLTPADATEPLQWSSLNETIASVDTEGNVTALKDGQAVIEASCGSVSAMCIVRVVNAPTYYLTFETEGESTLSLAVEGVRPNLFYSRDLIHWDYWDYSAISFTKNSPLYLIGDNKGGILTQQVQRAQFVATGSLFSCSGSIMSLIDSDEPVLEIPSDFCFAGMFRDCELLKSSPDLPATKLKDFCYSDMFIGCKNLLSAPELPALSTKQNCYNCMFARCSSLTITPDLPATDIKLQCYYCMFSGCTALNKVPDSLPATSLEYASACYYCMFKDCINLTTPPSLPATTLANYCYSGMFLNCTSLTQAPALPATTLCNSCYEGMFSQCTQLQKAPDLPAANILNQSYEKMFYGCSKLSYIKCLATWASSANSKTQWVNGVAENGVFVCSAAAASWWKVGESDNSGIPANWSIVQDQ